jgi:hypothetical protein
MSYSVIADVEAVDCVAPIMTQATGRQLNATSKNMVKNM